MTALSPDTSPVRLTSLAHGGGCGCKLAPAVLQSILKGMPATASFADLMVGTDTSDDAAVWRLNDQQALVATTDFFMPVAKMSPETIGAILAGGASVCAAAGIPVAGGHSIDSAEPIYGLVALGLV
ncbi:MAG: AIR synthase related protein, partial [Phenylobacterium sp.]